MTSGYRRLMADSTDRRFDAQIVYATTTRQRDAVDSIAARAGLRRSVVMRALVDHAITNGGLEVLLASTLTPSAPTTV